MKNTVKTLAVIGVATLTLLAQPLAPANIKKMDLFGPAVVYAQETEQPEPVWLMIDGWYVEFQDQGALIVDGVMMIPIESVFIHMGYECEWHPEQRALSGTKDGVTIYVPMDQTHFMVVQGEDSRLIGPFNPPSSVVNDRIVVSLESLGVIFGMNTEWDKETNLVQLISRPELPTANVPATPEGELFNLINAERQARGLAPLIWASELEGKDDALNSNPPYVKLREIYGVETTGYKRVALNGDSPWGAMLDTSSTVIGGGLRGDNLFIADINGNVGLSAIVVKEGNTWNIHIVTGLVQNEVQPFVQMTPERAYELLMEFSQTEGYKQGDKSGNCVTLPVNAQYYMLNAYNPEVKTNLFGAGIPLTADSVLMPGDIIHYWHYNTRIGTNDGHYVLVLAVKGDTVVVAESNYGGSVNWGREISRQELINKDATYGILQYHNPYTGETIPLVIR